MVSLILLAWAAAQEPVHEARWGPARTLGTFEHEGATWVVYEARADRQVRLRCDGPAPRRVAVHLREDGETLVHGPWPEPTRSQGTWQLGAASSRADLWAIDRTDCPIDLWREETAPEALDRLEHDADDPAALRSSLLSTDALREAPVAREAMEGVPDDAWWPTWTTLRPLGGFVDLLAPPRPEDARRVDGRHGPADPARPFEVDAGTPWSVIGPSQIRLSARALGTQGRLCLSVTGPAGEDRACQHTKPLESPRFRAGEASTAPSHEGSPVGRRLVWQAWVPPGRHELVLDGAALAWGRRADVDVLSAVAPLPGHPHVLPLTSPLPEDLDRVPATPSDDDAEVVFGPTTSDWPAPDAPRWVRPEAVDGRPWWDETGRASLLLDGGEGVCTVTLPDGRAWSALRPRALLHVARVGGAPTATALPEVLGDCTLRLRVAAREHEPDAQVGVPVARLDPGRPVSLSLPPEVSGPVRLRVFPAAEGAPVHVRVRIGAEVRTWRLDPVGDDGAWRSPDGARWLAPVTLPLSDETREIAVEADRRLLVQLSGRVVRHARPEDAPRVDESPSRTTTLRRHASDALLRGDPREARRAMLLAAELDPSLDASEVARAVAAASLEAWALPGAWQPLDTSWIPAEAPPALLARAAAGDDLAVARALDGHALPWWLAASREQVLGRDDTIAALHAVLASGADPEDPAFGAIRRWTRAVPIPAVRGTVGWSAPRPPSEPAPFDAPWPAAETVALGGGWSVRLPPLDTPLTLEARCRPDDVEALADPCRLRRVDTAGRVVDAWTLERWGAPTRVPLDASDRTTFLEVEASGRVDAALHVPSALHARLPTEARVLRLTRASAELTVVAPAVLEVTWWAPGEAGEGRLLVGGERRTVSIAEDPQTAWLAVPGEGAQRVVLDLGRGTLLRVLRREPRDARAEPPDHGPLLAALRRPVSSTAVVVGPSTTTATTTARPSPPALTIRAEARAGLGAGFAQDPEATASVPVRGLQRLGLLSRPGHLPLWIDLRLGAHEQLGRATAGEARVGLETWWRASPVSGWVRADTTIRSAFQSDLPTALRLDADAGLGWRPRRLFELRAVFGVHGRRRWGPWPARFGNAPDILWSSFVEDHPLQGSGRLEARVFPTPWLRATVFGAVRSNAPGDRRPVDAVGGGMALRAAFPGVRLDGSVSVEHRPADRHRVTPYLSPQLDLGARGTLWARHDVAVQLVGRAAWLPYFRRVQGDVAVEVLWSTRPGLQDLRPSLTDARFAHTWHQPERWIDWGGSDTSAP